MAVATPPTFANERRHRGGLSRALVRIDAAGSATRVSLGGQLDTYTVAGLRRRLAHIVGLQDLELDLRDVALVDSAGLALLARVGRAPGVRVIAPPRLSATLAVAGIAHDVG